MSRDYSYLQTIVLKTTLESISLDFRRGLHEEDKKQEPSEITITLMESKISKETTEE
ncbi:hypothetical protein NUSPORA_01048 [Nucleospora cyclopteri]